MNIAAFIFYIILYLSSFLGIKKAMTFTGYRSKSSIGISLLKVKDCFQDNCCKVIHFF